MSTPAAPSVVLERVSRWYGEVLGLNDVSAEFGSGVSGLLGPNGAGKSTLMKLACGMLSPNMGTVRVAGLCPRGGGALMRRVGHCPEQDPVYPRASALAVVTYLTRLHGFSRLDATERARAALQQVGLEDVADRSVQGFSKGMRQRFKLAQALAHEPDVLILDEPLNGLDPPGRRGLGELIRGLGREGRCVLVSSHILHEVESLCDRVLLLASGRVLAEGTVAEIRRELPDHPLTLRIESGRPRPLAARLLAVEGVEHVSVFDQALEVVTRKPDDLLDHLAVVADDPDVSIDAFAPIDEDLEAVFRYLTQ